jgi:ABC-type uncharacterized transport system ATPase component
MDCGHLVLDLRGRERLDMTARKLADLFGARAGHALSDRTMLALKE